MHSGSREESETQVSANMLRRRKPRWTLPFCPWLPSSPTAPGGKPPCQEAVGCLFSVCGLRARPCGQCCGFPWSFSPQNAIDNNATLLPLPLPPKDFSRASRRPINIAQPTFLLASAHRGLKPTSCSHNAKKIVKNVGTKPSAGGFHLTSPTMLRVVGNSGRKTGDPDSQTY